MYVWKFRADYSAFCRMCLNDSAAMMAGGNWKHLHFEYNNIQRHVLALSMPRRDFLGKTMGCLRSKDAMAWVHRSSQRWHEQSIWAANRLQRGLPCALDRGRFRYARLGSTRPDQRSAAELKSGLGRGSRASRAQVGFVSEMAQLMPGGRVQRRGISLPRLRDRGERLWWRGCAAAAASPKVRWIGKLTSRDRAAYTRHAAWYRYHSAAIHSDVWVRSSTSDRTAVTASFIFRKSCGTG